MLDRFALRRLFVGTSLLVVACAGAQKTAVQTPGSAQPTAASDGIPSRLPKSVRPLAYALELTVMPKNDHFSGRTQITVVLENASQRIWINGKVCT